MHCIVSLLEDGTHTLDVVGELQGMYIHTTIR